MMRILVQWALPLLAFHLLPTLLGSQPIRFGQLNMEHGLSQNTVNCMLKDHRGYLWIGTNDGLNRYDGYKFTTYRNRQHDTTSLSDNKIYALLEDRHGNIWVGTKNGLNRYERERDGFRRFLHDENDPYSLADNFIRTICEDSKGRIWIGTLEAGLSYWNAEKKSFHRVPLPELKGQPPIDNISSILEDQRGNLWVAGDPNGLFRRDHRTQQWSFQSFENDTEQGGFAKKIYEDSPGNIWVATQGAGLYLKSAQDRSFQRVGLGARGFQSNIIKDIIEVEDGQIWVATDGAGITILDNAGKPLTQLQYRIEEPYSIASNAVYSFFQDPQGILWIGTFDGGISIYDPNNKDFHHISVSLRKGKGLSHRSVLCFLEDREHNIWIGTDGGGLNCFDRKQQTFTYFTREPGNEKSLSSDVVTDLLEDSEGRIWIGTYAGGLQCFEKERGITTTYQAEPGNAEGLRNNNVWSLIEDDSGMIWVGTLGGLDLLNPKTGRFTHLSTQNGKNQDPYLERVTELYRDSKGNIWVGGKGVRRYDPGSGTLRAIGGKAGAALHPYDSRTFCEDSDGNFWIGTEGGGLFLLDREQQTVRHFDTSDGLPSNVIHHIEEDEAGYLWMSTNKGLSRCSPALLLDQKAAPSPPAFRNYCREDGLQSDQFSYGAGMRSHAGELFFGGINGFNFFKPSAIRDNNYRPPVEITALKIFNQYVQAGKDGSPLEKPVSELESLTLPYNQSLLFSLEFTALNFTSSNKNQYAYRLKGFMDDWSYIGAQRSATFTNLNPGDYIFEVKAANNDGVWNEEGASLALTILPPFWKTKWAYACYASLFVLVLLAFRHVLLIRERLRNDLKIKELERQNIEEISSMKLAFFTNISHEFRTPLTLISGPVEQLLNAPFMPAAAKRQLRLIQRNTQRLLRLVNQLLDFRKIEDRKMPLEIVRQDLVGFIRNIVEAFENLADTQHIEYAFRSEWETLQVDFDPDKIDKIVYNLLSNAFKFTSNRIIVSLGYAPVEMGHQRPSMVCISVEDNGPGIAPENQSQMFERFFQTGGGTGIGLALAKALTELHGGKIEVDSKPGRGSRFLVLIPQVQRKDDEMVTPVVSSRSSQKTELSVSPVREDQLPSPDESEKGPANKSKPVLLIVEDNPEVRSFIHSSLGTDFQVVASEDGERGIKEALEIIPDIIISDVMMPGKDGIELCRTLKADNRSSHIPIILLTANTSEERCLEGLDTGADDYLTKPFKLQVLKARIRNLIRNRQQLKKHFSRSILQPEDVEIESPESRFINEAIAIIEIHMEDSDFGVCQLAKELGMSRSVLYRKFSALTDQSVKEFINMIRLKRAGQLLTANTGLSVAEVAYSVGFNDSQYFSKKFKKFYHLTPTQYMKKNGEQTVK